MRRHPAGGQLQPVTVSREVPVTVLRHGDGRTEVINHDTAEPCYACACCASWARNLDQLAGAMREHSEAAHELTGAPTDASSGAVSCLVCVLLAGELDEGGASV